MGDPRARMVLERRPDSTSEHPDYARDKQGQPVAAGVDDAGLAKRRQQIGSPQDRALGRHERGLDDPHDRRVLRLRAGIWRQPGVAHPGDLRCDLYAHLTDHGQDRPFDRLAH